MLKILMKGFDPLQMLTSVFKWLKYKYQMRNLKKKKKKKILTKKNQCGKKFYSETASKFHEQLQSKCILHYFKLIKCDILNVIFPFHCKDQRTIFVFEIFW